MAALLSTAEEYKVLIQRSKRFPETARMQLERGFYDLAAFTLEQALQLYLKALLARLGAGYPRTHSLRRLLSLLGEAEPRLRSRVEYVLKRFMLELALLEDAYIASRYIPRVLPAKKLRGLCVPWWRSLKGLERLLASEARRRREVFENPDQYLRRIVETVKRLDPRAEVYLTGSVVEGRYMYSSDIDVVVVTTRNPAEVRVALWRQGIEDPFEIHVVEPRLLEHYRRHGKLVKLG